MKIKNIVLILLTIFTVSLPFGSTVRSEGQPEVVTDAPQFQDSLEEDLLLLIPPETDNPNLSLVFADPSGRGVQLKIDGQEFAPISSPHTLPALAIGAHTLTFKYTDAEEVEQESKRTLVIIPRAPVINPPDEITNNTLVISGTTLPLSTVKVFLSGGGKTFTAEVTTETSGEWEFVFEEEFKSGIYSIVAIAKKNGIASDFSESVVFSIEKSGDNEVAISDTNSGIAFTFAGLNSGNIISTLRDNRDLAILLGVTLLLGFIICFLLIRFTSFFGERKVERFFKKQLHSSKQSDTQDETKSSTPSSLKDKFESAGFKTDKYANADLVKTETKSEAEVEVEAEEVEESDEIEETPKEEVSEKKSEMSKEEFLKKFKEHDPDEPEEEVKEEIKEVKPKKEKKPVAKAVEDDPKESLVKSGKVKFNLDMGEKNDKKKKKDAKSIKITLTSKGIK